LTTLLHVTYGTIISTFLVMVTDDVHRFAALLRLFPKRRTMKKLNKVAMLFASAALVTAAGAQVKAADGGKTIDNWQNGTSELVWKNGTNELCWRDANWTPATAAVDCDGALKAQAAAPAPAVVPPAPVAPQPAVASRLPTLLTLSSTSTSPC
jgi:hypothetical protein